MAQSVDELVNTIVDSYNGEDKVVSYDELSTRVEYLMSEDVDNFFTIIKALVGVYEVIDCDCIADYAIALMTHYLFSTGKIRFSDTCFGLSYLTAPNNQKKGD